MAPRFLLGGSDFADFRESGAYYVDKTGLIRDIIDSPAQVSLIPRPRRFGKTLNLSMLRYWFEPSKLDRAPMFRDLDMTRAGEQYSTHFQRHPVISLTFKDTKAKSWAQCKDLIEEVIVGAAARAEYILDENTLGTADATALRWILDRRASDAILTNGLMVLSRVLAQRMGQKVVILIDEYDTPIHAAVTHGYGDEALSFLRNFLSAGLKDNPFLYRGVLTGILHVARESLFSGLNNLAVYSILRPELSGHFGFTEDEVEAITLAAGHAGMIDELRTWYDGYVFGGRTIYNPWSVLSFVVSEDHGFRPYWTSTGSDDLLRNLLLQTGGSELHTDMETLLSGGSVEKPIEENVALRDLGDRSGAAWSLLLFSGYLRAMQLRSEGGALLANLEIPNREVLHTYQTVFRSWLGGALGGSGRVDQMTRALLAGDAEGVALHLSDLLSEALSYHDVSGPDVEKVYQAFIVGLLVHLEPRYLVRSNRESGYGRYDVMLLPRMAGEPGVVLELKRLDPRVGTDPTRTLDEALEQIARQGYATELRAVGAAPIHEMAAVFDGKRVWAKASQRLIP